MQSRFRRISLTFASLALGGYLTATGGCLSFIGESVVGAIDVCFIIDCTDGLSGLIQPCISSQGDQLGADALFLDCPDRAP